MALDDDTLALLRELRAEGLKAADVAARLNEAGHLTERGRPWSAGNVYTAASEAGLTARPVHKAFNRGSATNSGAARNIAIHGRWASIEEAAELLGLSTTETWNVARTGEIRSWFPGDGRGGRMFLRRDLDALIAERISAFEADQAALSAIADTDNTPSAA